MTRICTVLELYFSNKWQHQKQIRWNPSYRMFKWNLSQCTYSYTFIHVYLLDFLYRKLLKTCLCATAFQLCLVSAIREGQIKSGGNETKYNNDYNEGGLRVNSQKCNLIFSAECRTNFSNTIKTRYKIL